MAVGGRMYLRRHRLKKGGTEYETWSLVESVRTIQGPRQRIVATIGKLPGLNKEERIGWEEIARVLDGKPRPERDLFEEEEEVPGSALPLRSYRLPTSGIGQRRWMISWE